MNVPSARSERCNSFPSDPIVPAGRTFTIAVRADRRGRFDSDDMVMTTDDADRARLRSFVSDLFDKRDFGTDRQLHEFAV